jgi:hypothetical protein
LKFFESSKQAVTKVNSVSPVTQNVVDQPFGLGEVYYRMGRNGSMHHAELSG